MVLTLAEDKEVLLENVDSDVGRVADLLLVRFVDDFVV